MQYFRRDTQNNDYDLALIEERYEEVEAFMSNAVDRSQRDTDRRREEIQKGFHTFRRTRQAHDSLKKTLRQSLLPSIAAIVSSLILLALVPSLRVGTLGLWAVILLALTVLCMLLYSRVIASALGISLPWQKSDDQHKKTT